MLTTAGFTCVAFVAGALSWFGPKVMYLGLKIHAGNENIELSEWVFKEEEKYLSISDELEERD